MSPEKNHIPDALPERAKALEKTRDILLGNLALVAETPAPTFSEQARAAFLQQRFCETGLQNISSDEKGNAVGIIPGAEPEAPAIAVVAHMDTVFPETTDHTITVEPNQITGPAVGNNSLGVAALATLPTALEMLGLRFNSPLVLLGTAQSLGRGNLGGLRFFLSQNRIKLRAGICVEGMLLGRLSFKSLGMLQGEIRCEVPETYDWTHFGAAGGVITMHQIINRILAIPLPQMPRTTVVLGSIGGGASFGTPAHDAFLRFQVLSESEEIVSNAAEHIDDACVETASETGAHIEFETVARRSPGGLEFSHAMVRAAREILKALGIMPRIAPSMSELSAFIDKGIPAITLGLTTGENLNEPDEKIQIAPVFKGMAQLTAMLEAIDKGCCDEHQ